ncbi:MAG: galactose mutarotase [Dysgonamonadaceae bacterium]|jgi:aldose 1-epimerase|nr:galactose mutarotase [Dysgonamonadaceae bacterium]
MKTTFAFFASMLMLISCGGKKDIKETTTASGLIPAKFETTLADGKKTQLYTIKNANGIEVSVINIGGRIVSIWVPDKNGGFKDIVLGFDNIDDYNKYAVSTNFGAIIGRYGNRIGGAKMTLRNNATYTLRPNDNGKNTLHGGPRGFHTRYFDIEQTDGATLVCRYKSANEEEGFPGEMLVTVTYSLTNDNALKIDYEALTNITTVCNLTNHSYFNLSGDPNKTILDQILYLDANAYTPTDIELIPTGKIDKVAGTPLDFTTPTVIGGRINDTTFEAIKFGNGYDHNYVLNNPGNVKTLAAKVVCPVTGIGMEVYTTEPGIQVYSGNFLDGSNTGKKGIAYQQRTALCLETQHFPNSPNIRSFPSVELWPDSLYKTETIYKFVVEK